MFGAISGDIIGSVYEHSGIKSTIFELFNPSSRFTDDTVCQGSVPEAIIAFLEFGDYEDPVRKAVSLGGDSEFNERFVV